MEKLEQLTPEMEARLDEYVQKGIATGLCTERVDKAKAKEYGKRLMEALGRDYVATIVMDGPTSTWAAVTLLSMYPEIARGETPKEPINITEMPTFVWPWLDGQFMAHWVAWADYYREVVGLDMPDYSIISDHVQFGPVYPLTDVVVICDRTLHIHKNANGLHKDGGAALEYLDGTKVWALNGVRVPQWLAEKPIEEIDCAEFARLDNVEVRREFVRKVGIERITSALDTKVLDKQGDYELLMVPLGGETGDWPYLKMLNPSIGVWHLEAVDKSCTTVKEALTWRNQSSLEPEVLT
jgi:hypothetical protein